jgi:hypothetical protein
MTAGMTRKELTDALLQPFEGEAVKQRQGGGGRNFDYIEGHTVIHRLIDATDNDWSMEVIGIETMPWGNQMLVRAHVRLLIPILGHRDGVGVQVVDPARLGSEDMVKGAITDALKVAAKHFGVALHLYGPDYGAGETGARPKTVVNGQAVGTYERGTGNPEKWEENEKWVADALSDGQGKAIYAIGRSIWELSGSPGGKYDEASYLLGAFNIADKNKLSKREASELIEKLNDEQVRAKSLQTA